MVESTGMADLRAENVSRVVTSFALQEYRMKQICMVQSSSAWKETYWKETAADLTAKGNLDVKGVPRLANFPYGEVTWTEASSRHLKHAMEGVISWEDAKTNEVDVITRTLLRIARSVTKSVDTEIYSQLSSNTGNTVAAADNWDSATVANRNPIQDVLNAIKLIQEDNYDPYTNGFLLLSPKDFANIMGNASIKNAGQFWTEDVTKNGRVGRLLGLTIVVSNTVTADEAMVAISKECATWKSASALRVNTIEDPGIKYKIRAYEVGTIQVKNPDAICTITDTQL